MGNDSTRVQDFIDILSCMFSLKDLDELNYFLGVEETRSNAGMLLNQRKYIMDLLHWTNMASAKPFSSPMMATDRHQLTSGTPLSDGIEYIRVVGSLQYLNFTLYGNSFAVNKLSQFMHCPKNIHWLAAKRVLWYLAWTRDRGIFLRWNNEVALHAFSYADWTGDLDNYTSTGSI